MWFAPYWEGEEAMSNTTKFLLCIVGMLTNGLLTVYNLQLDDAQGIILSLLCFACFCIGGAWYGLGTGDD